MQGEALAMLGLGPSECSYRVIASGARWQLRAYANADAAPPLLIVAAPIKRPYIWDLAPLVSVVRRCLEHRLGVYLLEWLPPLAEDGNAGLEDYAGRAISEAVASCSRIAGESRPFLVGHSLGGTLAAIFAALHPASIRGLVLLSSPLCFAPGSSRFRDALVAIAPSEIAIEVIAGTLLSQFSAIASPRAFVWSRLIDAALCIGDPAALDVHARVERWSLDEFPLTGRLVSEILQWLYREDRFCSGTLWIGDNLVDASSLAAPTLAVANAADEIAPRASMLPFFNRMRSAQSQLLEYPGEVGVCFPHLAPLIGRVAHAWVWPRVFAWLHEQM